MQTAATKIGAILLFAAWLGGAKTSTARDFWLEPATSLPTKGEELVVRLQAGKHLEDTDERPLQKDRVLRFDLYGDQAARRDLLSSGQDGQTPAAKVKLENGSALIVMDRKGRQAVMDADQFNHYLNDEGQDTVLAQRAHGGQADAEGRETYTRYLKALVQERNPAAATANTLYKRRVGQRLEILLESDPGSLEPGRRLTVKVLFEGNPVAGLKVTACHRNGDDEAPQVVAATTSAKGLAEFKFDQPGFWLVRTVYARASGGSPRPETPWESFWATYTFAVRYAAGPAMAAPPATSPPKS